MRLLSLLAIPTLLAAAAPAPEATASAPDATASAPLVIPDPFSPNPPPRVLAPYPPGPQKVQPLHLEEPSPNECEPSPDGKYRDANEDAVHHIAEYACSKYRFAPERKSYHISAEVMHYCRVFKKRCYMFPPGEQGEYGCPNTPLEGVWYCNQYRIEIHPIEEDKIEEQGWEFTEQDLLNPLPNYTCQQALFDAWKKCYSNKGRGGTVKAGFLSYSLKTMDVTERYNGP